ncbi:MAG: FAD-binding oxidoreductase, partial [Fidelibacterota bacterium]
EHSSSESLSRAIRDIQLLPDNLTVLTCRDELDLYSFDGLKLHKATPGCVVLPRSTMEIQKILRICNRHNIPFTARGAGTGLSGGATSDGGVIIQLSRMNQIIEIDYPNRCAVVQPGVVNSYLSLMTRPQGYHFAPDPSSQIACTIGGNVAENAGGPHTLKYGVTLNHVLGLTLVQPDGEVLKIGSKSRYHSGMDLIPLVIGSEGTLGIVSEIIVNLEPIPETTRTFLLIFDDVAKATDMVAEILESGIIPAALEMIDELCIQAVESTIKAGYPLSAKAVLLVELDGSHSTVNDDAEKLRLIAKSKLSQPIREAQNQSDRAQLWKGRKHAAGSMGKLSPAFYTNDGVVPRHKLTEILSEIYRISDYYQLRIANLCHAGDGNIHPLILYNPDKQGENQRSVDCSVQILNTCLEFGGSLTGEHGIGEEKKDLLPTMYSELYLHYAKGIQRIFDPKYLANPGKIFPGSGGCGELKSLNGGK